MNCHFVRQPPSISSPVFTRLAAILLNEASFPVFHSCYHAIQRAGLTAAYASIVAMTPGMQPFYASDRFLNGFQTI